MKNGNFSLHVGESKVTFDYHIDPPTPIDDYSYIIHHSGKVDLRTGLDKTWLNTEALREMILDQLNIDPLNPPLVIYIKVH